MYPPLTIIKTKLLTYFKFLSCSAGVVDKILEDKWPLQNCSAFYYVNPHFDSFPAMYNAWGLRIEEGTKKY